jgi:hypothetical protein
MSDNIIQVGDYVDIEFQSASWLFNVEVLYTPVAAGDSWHVRDMVGHLIYVQQFCAMWRRQKEKEHNEDNIRT